MPRENRKRGKKHKKPAPEVPIEPQADEYYEEPGPSHSEPSWILPAAKKEGEDLNTEAPFGMVDPDVKAYFRSVDTQIKEWQESRDEDEDGGDADPNEHKRMFFMAALNEMRDKEKQLATDPEVSVVIERMSYSMDDFVRRVFMDSLSGSYGALVKHRFSSHVCQTLFTVAKDTVARESKGLKPSIATSGDEGELRTLTQLILDICEELLPSFSSLLNDPYGSHVMRSLLLLLSPNLATRDDTHSAVRSKKSAFFKARQGKMKSVFDDPLSKEKGKGVLSKTAIPEFRKMAKRIVQAVREELGENEIRAMAASQVACPGLKMLLEVEADQDMANQPNSLMDRVTVGAISSCLNDPTADIQESDYLGTLLRDPNSSHLLETVVLRCPNDAFGALWKAYFEGKLARLAIHPVANFVVAQAFERISVTQLESSLGELHGSWNKMIRAARTGPLRALVDRATTLNVSAESIPKAVYSAFEIKRPEDYKYIVPCVLALLPLVDYKAASENASKGHNEPQQTGNTRGRRGGPNSDPLEPKVQGSVLLQSLLRLPEPLNEFIVDSIQTLPVDERLKIAHNASGSRVYDVLLDSSSVPSKLKRQFVMGFIGHYHLLVDDKFGSRVGERCWEFCDTYLKEKIARSLVNNEQDLAASFYGKFFSRSLNLHLLQRKPGEWRDFQAAQAVKTKSRSAGVGLTSSGLNVNPASNKSTTSKKATAAAPTASTSQVVTQATAGDQKKEKKKRKHEDEIDALFNETLGKKVKRAALGAEGADGDNAVSPVVAVVSEDKELQKVLGAIKLAPKSESGHPSRKKAKHR